MTMPSERPTRAEIAEELRLCDRHFREIELAKEYPASGRNLDLLLADAPRWERRRKIANVVLEMDTALRDIAEGNGVPYDKLALQPAAFYKWFVDFLQEKAQAAMLLLESDAQ